MTVQRDPEEREINHLWYWDSLGEAQAHIAEKWPEARVPEEVLAETQRQMARAGDGARVRATARVVISRWRRLGP